MTAHAAICDADVLARAVLFGGLQANAVITCINVAVINGNIAATVKVQPVTIPVGPVVNGEIPHIDIFASNNSGAP